MIASWCKFSNLVVFYTFKNYDYVYALSGYKFSALWRTKKDVGASGDRVTGSGKQLKWVLRIELLSSRGAEVTHNCSATLNIMTDLCT